MDKLRMTSPDLTDANIGKLAELFPTVITETTDADGNVTRAVDFDLLRQELSDHIVEGPQERYRLDWPGKRAAAFAANTPIAKTLRPVREESIDFDTTKNIFIEGDNLYVLKLLQESYLGKVKVIYIDPPYNTGHDFVYQDDFSESRSEYVQRSEQYSASGVRLIANPESNGRFHSDWLSMMYSRLKLSRNLLKEDGVVFISIDSHEVANLRRIMDEIFGTENFIENYVWESNFRPDNSSRIERENAQHILCYARNRSKISSLIGAQKVTEGLPSLTKSSMNPTTLYFEPEWVDFLLDDGFYESATPNSGYILEDPIMIRDGKALDAFRLTGRVIWSQQYLEDQISDGTRIVIKSDGFVPYSKKLQTTDLAPTTLIPRDVAGDVLAGNAEINALFNDRVFNHPKPTTLLKYLIKSVTFNDKSGLILDFFAGSGSTAHAVLDLNSEDGGSRNYIMVQLNEAVASGSTAEKSGYEFISQISRERIRRAAEHIGESVETENWDGGFRAFHIDSSNMNDNVRTPDDIEQLDLSLFEGSVKDGRTGEDLLFQVFLDWGLDLSMSIVKDTINGSEVFYVEDDALAACFEDEVSLDVIREMAKRQPLRAVFRDDGFTDDAARINAEQIFRELSPATDVKAI
jgi:adenine-specific DNA-methyltransferase